VSDHELGHYTTFEARDTFHHQNSFDFCWFRWFCSGTLPDRAITPCDVERVFTST
jgi:hypothetical protein